jgi:hypothetical protein
MTASLATVTWGPSNSQTPISSSPTVPDFISTCSSPSPCCSSLARPRWPPSPYASSSLATFVHGPAGYGATLSTLTGSRCLCSQHPFQPLHTHCDPVAQPRLRLDFTPLDHAGTSLVTSTLHSSQLSERACTRGRRHSHRPSGASVCGHFLERVGPRGIFAVEDGSISYIYRPNIETIPFVVILTFREIKLF